MRNGKDAVEAGVRVEEKGKEVLAWQWRRVEGGGG